MDNLLHYRLSNVITAMNNAKNPEFKAYWQGVYDALIKQAKEVKQVH